LCIADVQKDVFDMKFLDHGPRQVDETKNREPTAEEKINVEIASGSPAMMAFDGMFFRDVFTDFPQAPRR
jgi:hypothetical protein